ncbi:MAG: hypothetical protein JSS78_10655 [Bacteroidetes bacterium]|nr:hypothetical protein [Bacteroidota bacterium]
MPVREIKIIGNKHTARNIILRELDVIEGQYLHRDSLRYYAQSDSMRLSSMGLFTDIHVLADSENINGVIWHIAVKERWFIIPEPVFQLADRNFNVWWNEQNRDIRRIIVGATIRHKNVRGNLESLSATVQVGYTKRFGLEYLKPYVDRKQKHGFFLGFSVAESQETFYNTDSNKLLFVHTADQYILQQTEVYGGYIYRPAYATKHLLRLAYKQSHVEDTIISLNPNYFQNRGNKMQWIELAYRMEHNGTDNWNYPLIGTKFIGQLVSRFGINGMNFQSFATVELGKYFQVAPKWYVSTILRGRLSFPQDQPYALRSALGTKFDYVRGYEYYVVDGSQFGVLRFNFKRELFNLNIRKIPLKYLPVIPIRIYPKLFADAGYVQNIIPGNSFLNNRLLFSGGIGVDIVTFYDIKIRLEYAWNHLGQKDLFLHLNSE